MKNPLYKQILKGIFLCVFLLCILSLCLAFLHDLNLRRVGIETFFRESVYESRRLEHDYSSELGKVQACLPSTRDLGENADFSEPQKKATRSVHRLFNGLSRSFRNFPFPSEQELQKFSSAELFRLRNEMERALLTDHQLLFLLQGVKKELLAVSDILSDDDLELSYFSALLPALIYNVSGSIEVGEIERNLLSLPVLSGVGAELARNLIIMLILRSHGSDLAINFIGPLRSLLNFDPQNFASVFFDLRVATFRFSFYYRGINLVPEQQQFFFPAPEILTDPFAGYLVVNLRTNRIFERCLEHYHQQNSAYSFYSNRGLEIFLQDLQKTKDIFIYDPLSSRERESSSTELWTVFSAMREVLRFRYWHSEKGWLYAVIIPDSIFDDYIHLYEQPLNSFVRYDTTYHVLKIILLLLLVFSVIFIFVFPMISRPLRSFVSLIDQTGVDFSLSHIFAFQPVFYELSTMKAAFCLRLEKVNRNIQLRERLLHLQTLIRDDVKHDLFLAAVNNVYQEYFSKVFVDYDLESDILQLADVNVKGVEKGDKSVQDDSLVQEQDDSLAQEQDDIPVQEHDELEKERLAFDEQLKFYYQKEILEQDFLDSLDQNREFDLARQVQLSLLPAQVQGQKDYDISTFYLAARYLGGDFFEIIQSPEKSVFLIADVSGKGFGSSLFGAAVKSLFMAYYRKGLSLDQVFSSLNTSLIRHFHQQLFCTCFAAEKKGNNIEYCSAGHNNMYLVRQKELVTLWAEGLPFGLLEDFSYKRGSFDLLDQDLLFLYTDGCDEAESVQKTLFGDERLRACVLANSSLPTDKFKEQIYSALSEHTRGTEQSDDITYIITRFYKIE